MIENTGLNCVAGCQGLEPRLHAGGARLGATSSTSGSNWRKSGSPRLATLDVVSSGDSQALKLRPAASLFGLDSHPARQPSLSRKKDLVRASAGFAKSQLPKRRLSAVALAKADRWRRPSSFCVAISDPACKKLRSTRIAPHETRDFLHRACSGMAFEMRHFR